MKTGNLILAGVMGLAGFAYAGARHQTPAAPASAQNKTTPTDAGKALFVKRCAGCHNERGDKPLSSGLPLNERALSRDAIVRNVNGRLRSATEEDRRAVVDYIESFMKK
jgi:mono/diheme cytochrome c family protein